MKNLTSYAAIVLCTLVSSSAWSGETDKAQMDNSIPIRHSAQIPEDSGVLNKKKSKKEKKICKNNAPTGSRIGKKICLTKSAWDEMSRNARNSLDSSTKPTSNNRKGE